MSGYSRSERLPPSPDSTSKLRKDRVSNPAIKSRAKGASTLPQAGVQAQPKRQIAFFRRAHKPQTASFCPQSTFIFTIRINHLQTPHASIY
jgi:hypothetical protein